MLFPQEKRFESEKLETGPSEMYLPPSALSSKGTKIVDSWSGIDSSRFDNSLTLKNGLLMQGKKDLNEALPNIDPNVDIIKAKPPSYSFPKAPRSSQRLESDCGPLIVSDIPSTFSPNRATPNGSGFGYGKRAQIISQDLHADATILSMERYSLYFSKSFHHYVTALHNSIYQL